MGTTKPVDRKTMHMPCITSTLHVIHTSQTSQVLDSQTQVYSRVTQLKRIYVLRRTLTAGLCGQRVLTCHAQQLSTLAASQALEAAPTHLHRGLMQSKGTYMLYAQIMARMYQA